MLKDKISFVPVGLSPDNNTPKNKPIGIFIDLITMLRPFCTV